MHKKDLFGGEDLSSLHPPYRNDPKVLGVKQFYDLIPKQKQPKKYFCVWKQIHYFISQKECARKAFGVCQGLFIIPRGGVPPLGMINSP